MNFEQFKSFFSSFQLHPAPLYAAPKERAKPYEIVVIYQDLDTAYIEALVHQESQALHSGIEIISKELQSIGGLLRIGIHLKCPSSQRSAMVKLVSRLGLEASVRSVRWQSEPTQLNTCFCNADYRCYKH